MSENASPRVPSPESRVPASGIPGSRVPASENLRAQLPTAPALRPDLALICDWIRPDARMLDLGCGDGALLAHLACTQQVRGYGLEIDPENVARCVGAGVNVIQADIDEGLKEFGTQSFDVVVMTQALQALQRPDQALAEILRVGRHGIVTFPNFGHWRVRLALALGRMPVTPSLPERWFDTPNIHLCTTADFEDVCARHGWHILQRRMLSHARREGPLSRLLPNLFGEVALYLLEAGTRDPGPGTREKK